MKKKIILVLMILLCIGCVFGVAGCKSCKNNGGDSGIVTPEPPPDNEHKHAYLAEVTPPTCTSKGYTTFTCAAGDHSYIDNYVNALGHNYEERVVPFTCTNDGYTRMICTRGDSEYTKEGSEIAAHHVYTPRVVEPTCTEKGYTEYSCKVCNNSAYTEDYVEYIPHVFEDGACTACGGTQGLEYELTEDGAAYSVKGKGTATKTLINVLKVYNGKPVTKVSARAFENDSDLMGVNLPDSVTEIGAYALYGLANVTRLILPVSIETIGDFAISNCANLEELNLGESLKYLGKNALEYDRNLTTVVLPATLTDIGEYALSKTGLKSVIVGAKLERIGTGAFSDTPLASIDLPLSLEDISASAFANCRELEEVKFGGKYEGKVTSVGANAFKGCEKLEIISLPELESLGTGAFEGCLSLGIAILCNDLGAIPTNAFKNCASLTSVNVPDGTVSIGAGAFEGCLSLGVIELHDNIKEIGDSAFRNCGALKRIYMPRKLTSLGGYAFDGCDGISEFTIPETLAYIPAFAFRNCLSVTQITIPANIEDIKSSAFAGCVKLFEVYNLSSLDIVAGATTHGNVAENARNVYTLGGESKLKNEDGFIIYAEDKILLGYTGNAEAAVLPEDIDGASYEVYDYAFYKRSFKSVTVAENVTKIGAYAFAGCTNLTEINYNAAECDDLVGASHVFDNCGKNIILTFGDKVQVVPAYLFCGVDGLGEIRFEEGVCTEIHAGAFEESGRDNGRDYGLKIYLPESLESCDTTAFKNCFIGDIYFNAANLTSELFVNSELEANLTIGNKVRVINTGVFSSQNYRTFTIEAGSMLERIENDAFKNCRIYFGVHISDIGEWSGIRFGNSEANPLHVAEVLFLDDDPLTDATIDGDVSSFAFYGCGSLESVYIGDNATVAENAFGNCGALESISLPSLTGSFAAMFGQSGADSLWKVTIRSGEIPAEAFKEFTSSDELEVTLVNVTAIGASAFEDCLLLKTLDIQSAQAATIGEKAFYGCKNLSEITLPQGLKIIKSQTFAGCTALREIAIPDGVTEIDANAFAGCTHLKKISITAESSLTTIGAGAFENCRNLASIVIPANASDIAVDAFDGCNKLLEVYDLEGSGKVTALAVYTSLDEKRKLESINGYLFYSNGTDNFLVGYEGESGELVLPEDWNGASYKIYGYAFSYDDRIASVKISGGVTEIGANAFDGCTNLVYLKLGAGITDIRNNAFKDCAGLQTVIYGGSQEEWAQVRVESGMQEIFDKMTFEK